jgi:RNase H-fold protein (predicted Holliday junction resolvase)
MKNRYGHRSLRVLAVDPSTRGFGYAVFEAPQMLVDWGTKDIRQDKERMALRKIGELLQRYEPSVLVVEDCTHITARRTARIARLTEQMLAVARTQGVSGCAVPRSAVYRNFAKANARTKYEIALALTRRFPALVLRLPPKRKPWQSEDPRTTIFDAAAFGLTYLEKRRASAPHPPSAKPEMQSDA